TKPVDERLSSAGSGRLAGGALPRRGASPSQSAATRRAPWNRARKASSSGSMGRRLASAVRIVRPTPQPSRFCAPNSATCRTMSARGTSAAMRGLGDDKAEVVGEAVRKPLTPVRGGIAMTERGLHPDVTIAHLDRADRYVVRPQIEGTAAFEIEAGVVPMTGQDAVLETAALERKTHVRATIVEGEDTPAVVDDEDRPMATVHNEPALCLQLLKTPRERELFVRRVHEQTSRSCFLWGRCSSPNPPST